MRENRMLRLMRRELETESLRLPRQLSTLPTHRVSSPFIPFIVILCHARRRVRTKLLKPMSFLPPM